MRRIALALLLAFAPLTLCGCPPSMSPSFADAAGQ